MLLFVAKAYAQEIVVPLSQNPAYSKPGINAFKSKKTRATLPFIDDFSYEGPYPDATLWEDNKAYINNTMTATPVTRGVATLDGLNEFGRPYYPQPFNSGLADSLTTVPIDLSSYNPASGIFLSFFYQPQGLGFAPENKDSLFLYFKNDVGDWIRAWETRGTALQGFRIVVLPVDDVQFLHTNFQFRFVNVASLNLNDDVWNLDYIKLDANRLETDTVMNDVAFSAQPSSILKTYSSMPYRHFIANQPNELSATQDVEIRNLYPFPNDVTINLNATESVSGTPVNTQTLAPVTIASKSFTQQSLLSYIISYTAPGNKSKVVIHNQYFYPAVNATDRRRNDTIVNDAIFDNYFAYDDGSAEKSYFLVPAINFPAKTALQFTLNEPDTIRGLMVHFGSQAPTAAGKYFSMVLYKTLGGATTMDSVLLQEDLLQVQYESSYNGFSSYAFSNPILLPAGSYYIGIMQPANFGSDSIYYGLDVNNNTSFQHLSYSVDGTWYTSAINGSLMMRPIVGQVFTPTRVTDIIKTEGVALDLFPNPSVSTLHLDSKERYKRCMIYSMDGRLHGIQKVEVNNTIDISGLQTGNYILVFTDSKGNSISKKINKL